MENEKNGTIAKVSDTHELFTLVKINEKWRIAIGNTIISKKEYETEWDAENAINYPDIELIINIISLIFDYEKNNQKEPIQNTK